MRLFFIYEFFAVIKRIPDQVREKIKFLYLVCISICVYAGIYVCMRTYANVVDEDVH